MCIKALGYRWHRTGISPEIGSVSVARLRSESVPGGQAPEGPRQPQRDGPHPGLEVGVRGRLLVKNAAIYFSSSGPDGMVTSERLDLHNRMRTSYLDYEQKS